MKTWFALSIAAMVLFTSACTSTFLVYKDGKGYFLGSGSNAKFNMLCASGDLEKVLAATTQLSPEMKDSFYKYNCSIERSGDKVKQLFVTMTKEQRKDIRSAFKANGYDINRMAC
ncbi:MAG: hypothetical protein M0R70_08270 [Nitrospirae bacterium]|nr:hypothetical protein [Nitrospirota bacterium]